MVHKDARRSFANQLRGINANASTVVFVEPMERIPVVWLRRCPIGACVVGWGAGLGECGGAGENEDDQWAKHRANDLIESAEGRKASL